MSPRIENQLCFFQRIIGGGGGLLQPLIFGFFQFKFDDWLNVVGYRSVLPGSCRRPVRDVIRTGAFEGMQDPIDCVGVPKIFWPFVCLGMTGKVDGNDASTCKLPSVASL